MNKAFSDWYDSYPNGEPTYQETFEAGQRAALAKNPATDDPLQGAVNWLLQADGEFFCVASVQRTLRIGYNRAKRLADIAKELNTLRERV